MKSISRQTALSAFGAVGGATLLTGCGDVGLLTSVAEGKPPAKQKPRPSATDPTTLGPSLPTATHNWKYVELEAAEVADRAYRIYPDGGCMYAVVGSVVTALSDKVGEPFRSFPINMMRYGDGGVGAWGSLCGVVNGGSALIGLFHNEQAKTTRGELIVELCVWYESSALPQYAPSQPEWADKAKPSIAGSLLCHVSTAQWCKNAECGAFTMEKKERCRRLAADGAAKVVGILNRASINESDFVELSAEVNACIDCHGPKDKGDAMGKMNRSTCHQFDGKHP